MDLEKFAEAFAKRGLVPTIHIHEGTQIYDNTIDKFYLNGEADASLANPRAPSAGADAAATPPDDQLYYLLGCDADAYREVVRRAAMCERRRDIGTLLAPLLRRKLGALSHTEKTAALLIPHLTHYLNDKKPRNIATAI